MKGWFATLWEWCQILGMIVMFGCTLYIIQLWFQAIWLFISLPFVILGRIFS